MASLLVHSIITHWHKTSLFGFRMSWFRRVEGLRVVVGSKAVPEVELETVSGPYRCVCKRKRESVSHAQCVVTMR